MKLLRCVVLSTAVLAPVAAEAQDLNRHLAPMVLSSFPTPPANIISAKVFDPRGNMVGSIKGVATDAEGKPAAISVQPANGRSLIVVAAGAASYDQARNAIITSAIEPLGVASAK